MWLNACDRISLDPCHGLSVYQSVPASGVQTMSCCLGRFSYYRPPIPQLIRPYLYIYLYWYWYGTVVVCQCVGSVVVVSEWVSVVVWVSECDESVTVLPRNPSTVESFRVIRVGSYQKIEYTDAGTHQCLHQWTKQASKFVFPKLALVGSFRTTQYQKSFSISNSTHTTKCWMEDALPTILIPATVTVAAVTVAIAGHDCHPTNSWHSIDPQQWPNSPSIARQSSIVRSFAFHDTETTVVSTHDRSCGQSTPVRYNYHHDGHTLPKCHCFSPTGWLYLPSQNPAGTTTRSRRSHCHGLLGKSIFHQQNHKWMDLSTR